MNTQVRLELSASCTVNFEKWLKLTYKDGVPSWEEWEAINPFTVMVAAI